VIRGKVIRREEGRIIMGDKTGKAQDIVNKKKTTCARGIGKSKEERNTELALKLLRGYYQIYIKK
jgi:hypothetical protein